MLHPCGRFYGSWSWWTYLLGSNNVHTIRIWSAALSSLMVSLHLLPLPLVSLRILLRRSSCVTLGSRLSICIGLPLLVGHNFRVWVPVVPGISSGWAKLVTIWRSWVAETYWSQTIQWPRYTTAGSPPVEDRVAQRSTSSSSKCLRSYLGSRTSSCPQNI